MASTASARPRVSRETRLLFVTVVVSLVALWGLARLRYPPGAGLPSPVPAVLTSLAPPPAFDALALAVAQITPGIAPSVVAMRAAADGATPTVGVRLRDDVVVTYVASPVEATGRAVAPPGDLIAHDASSGIAAYRVSPAPAPVLATWEPRRPGAPRYLLAGAVLGDSVTWRPVFVAALWPVATLRWHGNIWALPAATDVTPGTPIFTLDGAWAGLAVAHRGHVAIVPAALVIAQAEQLMATGPRELATLGIEVEWASALVAEAAGSRAGVVVTRVDPTGPAAGHVAVADLIEAVAGGPLEVFDDWLARTLQFRPGAAVDLGIRRQGHATVVRVTPAAVVVPGANPVLGLTMRVVRRQGSLVTAVQPGSLADRAGVRAGDLVTLVGDRSAPTPAMVTAAIDAAEPGRPVLIAVARGDRRHVLAVVK